MNLGNICMATLALTAAALAQTAKEAPQEWLNMTIYHVKPEMRSEFESYQKQISTVLKKTEPFRHVWRNWTGDLNEYTIVQPTPAKFSEMSGPTPLEKALGKKAYDTLQAGLRRCLVSQSREFRRTVPAASIFKSPKLNYAMQVRATLNPDRVNELIDVLTKEFKPALEKDGTGWFAVTRSSFGEPSNTVYYLREMKGGLADIDAGPVLIRSLGAEAGRALNQKIDGMVRSRTTTILRFMDDLSFNNLAAAATN
jgi:hypothetical protein